MNTKGLTVIESAVALLVLGLVGLGYLQILRVTRDLAEGAHAWSTAVAYAEDALEALKLDPRSLPVADRPQVGFARRVEVHPWSDGLVRVTVVVTLPHGGRFELERLLASP